jgi:hypothetical protein
VPLLFTAVVGLVFGCGGFGLVVNDLDREIGEVEGGEADRLTAEFAGVSAEFNRV